MHSPATLGYLCAPPGHLWEWEDEAGSQSVQWHQRRGTIALRQELMELLEVLAPEGLPPLGAVLLVVAAASRNWDEKIATSHLAEALEEATGDDSVPKVVGDLWPKVCEGLEAIRKLPDELRSSGPARGHLLRIVFEGAFNRLPASMSAKILKEFQQTPYLEPFQKRGPELNGLARLLGDLTSLAKAFDKLPADALERRLRTGLDTDMAEQPELPWDDPEAVPPAADLLAALAHEGGELAQIAGIVKKLSAILHVSRPMAFQDDLPVGGLSDITNRGGPDRLLITELAWDDLTFAARLAHQEALYSRRESPPSDPPPERIILLDTGIHLWGKPRLFALGTALALLRQMQPGAGHFTKPSEGCVQTLALLDAEFTPVKLETVEAVRTQLGRLEPMPHPGAALERWLANDPVSSSGRQEVFLITHPAALEKVMQTAAWQELAAGVSLHSVQVDRGGALVLARHSIAGMRVLTQAKMDVDVLLPATAQVPKSSAVLTDEWGRLPRFYHKRPWPLYHPALPRQHCAFELPEGRGYVGISPAGCVCHWRDSGGAGRVLAPNAPSSHLVTVAVDQEDPDQVILVFRSDGWNATEIMVASLTGDSPASSVSLRTSAAGILEVRFQSGALVIHRGDGSQAVSLSDGQMLHSVSRSSRLQAGHHLPWFDGEKFHLQPGGPTGASVLLRLAVMAKPLKHERIEEIASAGFGLSDGLFVQKEKGRIHRLQIGGDGSIEWVACSDARATFQDFVPMELPEWPDHGLKQAAFPDGRRAIHDPRGFLHVIDVRSLEQLSIVMVKGSTVAWRRVGTYYGEGSLLWGETTGSGRGLRDCCQLLFRAQPILLTPIQPELPAKTF